MSSISKEFLSGSTNGRPISVAAAATPGTLIHTAVAGTDDVDEVWLYAVNTDTAARKLTIEFGGTTSPDDLVEVELGPEDGLKLIVPGLPLQNGLVVRAFAAAADVVNILGFVNRIDLVP